MHAISQTIKHMIDNTPGYSLDTLLADLGAGKQQEELLTSKEVQKLLRISHMTLWRYKKRGLIKPCHIGGGHPKYKKSEVIRAISNQ